MAAAEWKRGLRPLAEDVDVRGASSWSPDDEWIVIAGVGADGPGLFKIRADGVADEVVCLERGEALHPVWSPRGDLIVYSGRQTDAATPVRAIDPAGNPVPIAAIEVDREGERYRFSRDGSGLIYMQGLTLSQEFHLLDLATMETRMMTSLEDTAAMRTFDVSPDGESIVFDRERPNSDIVLIELD